jgi:hypothetical protein
MHGQEDPMVGDLLAERERWCCRKALDPTEASGQRPGGLGSGKRSREVDAGEFPEAGILFTRRALLEKPPTAVLEGQDDPGAVDGGGAPRRWRVSVDLAGGVGLAELAERAVFTSGLLREADRCAEFHEGLVEITAGPVGVGFTASGGLDKLLGQLPQPGSS